MRRRGRQWVDQTLRDELLPGWVLKRDDFDARAKLFEHGLERLALAAFGQCDQIHFVIPSELAQEVESAVVGATVQRVWKIRIKR